MSYANDIADALARAGFKVRRGGQRQGRQVWWGPDSICHGDDHQFKAWWHDDGKGGIIAGCFTGGCPTSVVAPALRAAAGIGQERGEYIVRLRRLQQAHVRDGFGFPLRLVRCCQTRMAGCCWTTRHASIGLLPVRRCSIPIDGTTGPSPW